MKTLARHLCIALLAMPVLAPLPAAAAPAPSHYSSAEIDRLLAPIALYPDTVLSQVLVASTYPLEVVEAARWSREHPELRGQSALDAAATMDWDASVRALVAFPELLARMDADLEWTQDLGDAFLGQQGEVMDRVQFLRDRAYESGHLDDVEHERIVRERDVIYIEPAVSEVVYLPYYDPFVVYGAWWWPAYPPYRWAYWGGYPAAYYGGYGTFFWGVGFRVAPTFYFCHFDWPARHVVVIHDFHDDYWHRHPAWSSRAVEHYEGASAWRHDPDHRRGVGYRDARMNEEYHHGYRRHDDGEPRGTWTTGHRDGGWHGGSWRGDDGRAGDGAGAWHGGNDRGGNDRGGNDRGGNDHGGNDRGGHGRSGNDHGGNDHGGNDRGGNDWGGHGSGNGGDHGGGWQGHASAGLGATVQRPDPPRRFEPRPVPPSTRERWSAGGSEANRAPAAQERGRGSSDATVARPERPQGGEFRGNAGASVRAERAAPPPRQSEARGSQRQRQPRGRDVER